MTWIYGYGDRRGSDQDALGDKAANTAHDLLYGDFASSPTLFDLVMLVGLDESAITRQRDAANLPFP